MLDYTIVLTITYIVIVGLLYAPRCPRAESQDFKVDYFPEIEEEVGVTVTPTKTTKAIATKPKPVTETAPTTDANPLDSLSIRSLKKLAATAKIRRYSSLTKAQLIHQLRGLGTIPIAV